MTLSREDLKADAEHQTLSANEAVRTALVIYDAGVLIGYDEARRRKHGIAAARPDTLASTTEEIRQHRNWATEMLERAERRLKNRRGREATQLHKAAASAYVSAHADAMAAAISAGLQPDRHATLDELATQLAGHDSGIDRETAAALMPFRHVWLFENEPAPNRREATEAVQAARRLHDEAGKRQ